MQGLIGDDERFRAPVAFQDLGYPRGRAGALHDVLRRDQERERDIHQAAGQHADALFDLAADFAGVGDLQNCIFKSHSFVVPFILFHFKDGCGESGLIATSIIS